METAILTVVAFEVQCPYCKEEIEHFYTDSLMWLIRDGDMPTGDIKAGQKIECPMCEKVFKLPTVIKDKLPH